ncbi:hypothetical protein LC048_24545 [Mesobacillus subterraneus]|uniref:hypothetical protein n=1 Tax=Mesobacillus subterraneus TaxID=285983 RepID=UPI001CFCA4DF|nr:hypothetical protein [Mesobacillus subterraneus]WLR55393.1 hypothetical protein LC048_24545 [Mesobacillus subterraneus]
MEMDEVSATATAQQMSGKQPAVLQRMPLRFGYEGQTHLIYSLPKGKKSPLHHKIYPIWQ